MKDGRPDGLRSIETRPWRPERFVRDPSPDLFGDGEHHQQLSPETVTLAKTQAIVLGPSSVTRDGRIKNHVAGLVRRRRTPSVMMPFPTNSDSYMPDCRGMTELSTTLA